MRWLRAVPLRLKGSRRVFREIYRRNAWRGDESPSGPGSGLARTEALRTDLAHLLRGLGCRSLLDAPCGDCHWMSAMPLPEIGIESYLGIDIVPEVIAANRRLYGAPGRAFECLDLIHRAPPRADLILCRDCLVHLSFRHALAVLANLRASGATYLLATTFPRLPRNADIATGEWRPLNLELPPFSLPPPLRLLDERYTAEGARYADKSLGLWRLADLTGIH